MSNQSGLGGLIISVIDLFKRTPHDLIAVLSRFVVGMVFWQSGLTKIDGFSIKASTFFLFANDFKLPFLPPDVAAYMATAAELACPILLWLGFGTRFAALALLIMTLVIQIFVFPGSYVTHGLWAIGLLYLIKYGPGVLSVDHFIARSRGVSD